MSIPDDADKNIGENLQRADDKVERGESGDAEDSGHESDHSEGGKSG